MRRAIGFAAILAGSCATGCWGVPSPLAPHLRGALGPPHDGMITDSVPLPRRGVGYEVICRRGYHFGHPRLIGAIERAARFVAEKMPSEEPLRVCDLSARQGGPVPRHRSHQNGRDADLLYFALTPDGRPWPTHFVRFGGDGLAEVGRGHFVRLDVERQWLLVRALITDPDAHVQWLFAARPIEALLIAHAIARGEPPEIVWRAEQVMIEPWDASPHDDHLHLRIGCTPDEAVSGCTGGGPIWPWFPAAPQLAPQSDEALLAEILEGLAPRAPVDDSLAREDRLSASPPLPTLLPSP